MLRGIIAEGAMRSVADLEPGTLIEWPYECPEGPRRSVCFRGIVLTMYDPTVPGTLGDVLVWRSSPLHGTVVLQGRQQVIPLYMVEPGSGVTVSYVNDYYPATVREIDAKGVITVTMDAITWSAGVPSFAPDRAGTERRFSYREKTRQWVQVGSNHGPWLSMGGRGYYRDPNA